MKHLLTSLAFLLLIAGAVYAGVPQSLKCKARKATATGSLASELLKALAKDIKKTNGTKFARSISKSRSRFAKAFSGAEARSVCSTTGDTQVLQDTIDNFVTDVFVEITSQVPLVPDQRAIEDCVDSAGQILASQPVGQEFTPSKPTLFAVEVHVRGVNFPYTDTLTVHIREGSILGPVLATVSSLVEDLNSPSNMLSFWHRFVLPLPLTLEPGSLYVIEVSASNPSFAWSATHNNIDPSCDYPGGVAIFQGVRAEHTDKLFRTYTSLVAP